jgi:hypothetical protein
MMADGEQILAHLRTEEFLVEDSAWIHRPGFRLPIVDLRLL